MFRRDPKRRGASQPARPARAGRGVACEGSGTSVGADATRGVSPESFVLYVEGARDREILSGWARHVAPVFGRTLERSTVILGGRQPARAVDDFGRRGGALAGLAGLVVLDRDDHREADAGDRLLAPGLERFVWSLRHIESYLLVPAAIRRVAPNAPDEATLAAFFAGELAGAKGAPTARPGGPHAKRLLGSGGALSASFGVELRAGEIARAMRRDELHADVHALFERIAVLRGVAPNRLPEVVVRTSARDAIGDD